jgi:uncharacterized protein (TIGR02246 family)
MQNDEQAIRELIETWMRATREGDVDTVLSLMTPDAVFLVPGQAPMHGREAFAQALQGTLGSYTVDATSHIDEITVCGELAYCRTQLSMIVTSRHSQTPVERHGHTLTILRRGADGKWLLARDANLLGGA